MKSFNKVACFFAFLLITSPVLTSAQQANWFKDVTKEVGLDSTIGRRLYFADLNNDDYPDLVLHDKSNRAQLQLFLNLPNPNGKGRIFKDTTEWSNINAGRIDSLDGRKTTNIVMGDVDNDGDKDLIASLYYHRRENYTDKGDRAACLLNNGNGKFTLKENSGLADLGLFNSTGMALLDYNLDGNIDIYISTWSQDHTIGFFVHDILMKGNGDGTFEDVSMQAGLMNVQPFPMYGVNITDWNNDGHQDVATSPYCRHGGDFWKNEGDGTFAEISSRINYNAQNMPGDRGQDLCQWAADPSDYDNDGDVDFYISLVHGGSGIGEGHSTLVENLGPDSNFKTKWALGKIEKEAPKPPHHGDFDADWFDINNDGFVDLVTGQGTYNPGKDRIYFFQQNANHEFDEITKELKMVNTFQQPNKIQVLDYDLDGDDDVMVSAAGDNSRVTLLENTIGNQNNWVSLELIPPRDANKDAIGARVYVYADGMTRMRDVYAGEGNMGGQSPFILNFGVGSRTIDSIRVRWPNESLSETFVTNPPMNQIVKINGQGIGGTAAARRKDQYKVFPNPVEDVLHVALQERSGLQSGKIRILNLLGQKQLEQSFSTIDRKFSLNVGHLNKGWYILHIVNNEGVRKSMKIRKR